MAIIGYLDEVIKNNKFSAGIKNGLAYLTKVRAKHFAGLDQGDSRKVELSGKRLFAINQVYLPKTHDLAKFEAHERYIDLQYILEGEETIFVGSPHDGDIVIKYDKEKDIKFYTLSHFSPINLKSGMVAIFFPEDIHAPSLRTEGSRLVKKSVVKVTTK
jgi:YhcH/YjgK/YiaL family protein